MNEELEKKEVVAEQPAPAQAPVDIAKIIEELREGGLADEQIVEALQQMVTEGKITEEDLAKAQELLQGAVADEKAQAEKLFGVGNLL